MTRKNYTSSVNRLASLPEIFTGGDLAVLFGWRSSICSTYLASWRKAGLIKSLGGRSDVHMNLVQNRQANTEAALRRVYPRATRIGVDILREAGWTTQIPVRTSVAVPRASARHDLPVFLLETRSAKWFARVAPGIERVERGIDRLHPAWALADMIDRAADRRVRGAWLLDPEDIDLQRARADKNMAIALKAFGQDMDCIDDADYARLYDSGRLRRKAVSG